MHVLLFANGDAISGKMVDRAIETSADAHILCADGGALNAVKFGMIPQTIIGDLDSLNDQQLHDFERQGTTILRHPPEKDETDLELALYWCAENNARWIRIIGGLGGRFDQTIANVYLLALPELNGVDIEIVEDKQAIRLLTAGETIIRGQAGDTISLIPMGGTTSGITTTNLKYPLKNESLHFGPARGVSNVMIADTATVNIADGTLLMVHTIGRA